jgi:hypothetical protein
LNDENHDRLLEYFAQLEDATALELDWQVLLTTRRSNVQLDACVIETLSLDYSRETLNVQGNAQILAL